MAAGKISEATGIPPSSLSFHPNELTHADMVTSRQEEMLLTSVALCIIVPVILASSLPLPPRLACSAGTRPQPWLL